MSWKQLEAFNYFQSGYVRTVFSRLLDHSGARYCLLKAKVNPSQKSPDSAREAWVLAKAEGDILSSHCTCMAG